MILDVSAPTDADPRDVKAYAAHVQGCRDCQKANTEAELCPDGGALWDAVCDEDRTDPVGVRVSR